MENIRPKSQPTPRLMPFETYKDGPTGVPPAPTEAFLDSQLDQLNGDNIQMKRPDSEKMVNSYTIAEIRAAQDQQKRVMQVYGVPNNHGGRNIKVGVKRRAAPGRGPEEAYASENSTSKRYSGLNSRLPGSAPLGGIPRGKGKGRGRGKGADKVSTEGIGKTKEAWVLQAPEGVSAPASVAPPAASDSA